MAQPGGGAAPVKPDDQVALSGAWLEVLADAIPLLVPGLKELAMLGALPPEVGLELADEKGRVLAECELAWTASKLVVLRPDQEDLLGAWQQEGWTVLQLDDAARVGEESWQAAAAKLLGLSQSEAGGNQE
jgi:DEAD/DEAH box helicase domain-containing protein